MRKSLKIAIIVLFAILLLMIGIKVEKSYRGTSIWKYGLVKNGDRVYVRYEDLRDKVSVVCIAHGVHLISYNNTVVQQSNGNTKDRTDRGTLTGYIDLTQEETIYNNSSWTGFKYRKNEKEIDDRKGELNPYNATTSETYALYEVNKKTATPKIAYILSHLESYQIPLYQTKAQYAIWLSDLSSNVGSDWGNTEYWRNNYARGSALLEEAKAFEDYICKLVAGPDKSPVAVSSLTYYNNTANPNDPNNGYVKLPNPAYTVSKGTNYKEENVKVLFDSNSNSYKIGPFSMKFISESHTDKYGTTVFAGITGATIKVKTTSGTTRTLSKSNDDFSFVNGSDSAIKYPNSNENFYIKLKYADDIESMTDLNFSFKYMNAAGLYEKLENATFNILAWEPVVDIEHYTLSTMKGGGGTEAKDFILGYLSENKYGSNEYELLVNSYKITPGYNDVTLNLNVQINQINYMAPSSPVKSDKIVNFSANVMAFEKRGSDGTPTNQSGTINSVTCEKLIGDYAKYSLNIKISNLERGKLYSVRLMDNAIVVRFSDNKNEILHSDNGTLPIGFSTIINDGKAISLCTKNEINNLLDDKARKYDDPAGVDNNIHVALGSNPNAPSVDKTDDDSLATTYGATYYYARYHYYLKLSSEYRNKKAQYLINVTKGEIKEYTATYSFTINPISFRTSLRRNGMVR